MASLGSFENVRANLDGAAITTYVLFMIVVPLKLWCRLNSGHKRLGLDDVLTAVGAIVVNAFFYITMIGKLNSHCIIDMWLTTLEACGHT